MNIIYILYEKKTVIITSVCVFKYLLPTEITILVANNDNNVYVFNLNYQAARRREPVSNKYEILVCRDTSWTAEKNFLLFWQQIA